MHLDNLLFFLLVAVALLFRWLASAANKAGGNTDETERRSTSTPPPISRMPDETDTARMRKFLEALGQPPGANPPPRRPIYPKQVVLPHLPPLASPLPPLKTRPPDLPRKITPAVVIPPAYEVQRQAEIPQPPAALTTKMTEQPRAIPLLALLKSSSGLRDAILLREIFGPPRGLQDVDLIGSA